MHPEILVPQIFKEGIIKALHENQTYYNPPQVYPLINKYFVFIWL